MLDCGVIARVEDQHAKAYSQVLLVNKPDGAKRFCIDFRALNMCISHMNWPLPVINQMLHRLGTHKPKYFAKFDMTKGYWQIALGEKFQLATAFITAFGIFKWKRIPMGIQPAASYFQYCMMVIVLAGLAYDICEAYIDDLIVHGKTEEELVENLRRFFTRLREYGIKLNPAKSVLGVEVIEYVGHTIDGEGMHFSREKLSEVAQYPTPTNAKQLRSFLGLAQYFARHVEGYVQWAEPMRAVLTMHDKSRKWVWSQAAEAGFLGMQDAIRLCPKLYFVSDDPAHKIYLRTDASQYGYGAYLFQKRTARNGQSCSLAVVSTKRN